MSQDTNQPHHEQEEPKDQPAPEQATQSAEQESEAEAAAQTETTEADDTESRLLHELEELKDSHLRLRAEYDNYRKRTQKEKAELIKSAGERTITAFLEVMDDFDLALKSLQDTTSKEGMIEGLDLIQHKLISTLKALGVSEMEVIGRAFDPEHHDAVAMVPSDDQKGMVMDCVQKGYILNDKVIRHPKVVVGS